MNSKEAFDRRTLTVSPAERPLGFNPAQATAVNGLSRVIKSRENRADEQAAGSDAASEEVKQEPLVYPGDILINRR